MEGFDDEPGKNLFPAGKLKRTTGRDLHLFCLPSTGLAGPLSRQACHETLETE